MPTLPFYNVKAAAGTNHDGLRPIGEITAPMMRRRLLSIKRARDAD